MKTRYSQYSFVVSTRSEVRSKP